MTSGPTYRAPLAYRRRPTRVVQVGSVPVGGNEPIRVQSMLTCNTWDVARVLAEIRELDAAGCEIVRLTVPTRKDLDALPEIRRRMADEGLTRPLVADIHFNPALALAVVPHVEKVRINPGNFVDQKRFDVREYTDAQYAEELARVEEALGPLIAALKAHKRSLRIGVNHGSLSDRILNRYGDTPEGMVECAMEYLRVLAANDYHEVIVSMKSSNPRVVIQAYRALVDAMDGAGMDYPLHLGVTEAGDGRDGRIKSAIGIGALLCDGLGDTIRVSLTERAANEIPAARALVGALAPLTSGPAWPEQVLPAPVAFTRRSTRSLALGATGTRVGGNLPVALLGIAQGGGQGLQARAGLPNPGPAPGGDGGFDAHLLPPLEVLRAPQALQAGAAPRPLAVSPPPPLAESPLRLRRPADLVGQHGVGQRGVGQHGAALVLLDGADVDSAVVQRLLSAEACPEGALLVVAGAHLLYPVRRLVQQLAAAGLDWPLGVLLAADETDGTLALGVAAQVGSLATEGFLDALVCPTDDPAIPIAADARSLLQGARLRTYHTEYISCPSCGRTLFDLEETTARIKAATGHLKGVKIGIMGCIVNGPGEMADADFGYVGGTPGQIILYKGQQRVARGVPADQAVERLIDLIKQHDAWVEPPA